MQRNLTTVWSRGDSLSLHIFKRRGCILNEEQTNSKSGSSLRPSSGRTPQNVVLVVMLCKARALLGFF